MKISVPVLVAITIGADCEPSQDELYGLTASALELASVYFVCRHDELINGTSDFVHVLSHVVPDSIVNADVERADVTLVAALALGSSSDRILKWKQKNDLRSPKMQRKFVLRR